jgi:Ran GTPase-activating protein (RanGAP) involved in mRNA processing and transport
VRLLERAFAGCSRVVVTKLHGGFSGSLVLKTDSYGLDGSRDEPTVTKLDDAVSMLDEVNKTAKFTKLVGASAAKVQRGPFLVDASGEPIVKDASTEKDFGCVVLDMAGACWVMPEFYGKLDTELISTFKQHVVRQLAVQPDLEITTDVMTVMQELWGAGGPLRALALETCKRSDTLETQPGGLIERALRGIITSLILAFRVPNNAEGTDVAQGYSTPPLLDDCLSKVLESEPTWLTEDWSSEIKGLQAKKFKHSLVHDCDAAVWRDEYTCKALVGLVEQLESLLQPGDSTWLASYKPIRMHQHGDLNCGNILVDVRNSLWLIDFAKAGEQALFVDAAKMVSVILFEQFPVPLTLDDLRRGGGAQKLVDALGASKDQADYLVNLATACDSKAALVKRLAIDGSHQRFLPFIDDNAVAEQRAKEACGVIDLLFKPSADGKQPQLWEMGERQPPADWPAYAQLALQLCARVLKVTTELVAECSRREQDNGEAIKEDLHPVQFLLPLLKRALSTLRYRDCGSWQKQVAWYAAQRLAEALTPLLRQPAQPLPASADRVLATELRLVAGQPIAMLGAAGRLDGGLGQRQLFLASVDNDSSAKRLISDETHPLKYDRVDQTVLPWHVPSPETVSTILELAQQDLATTVPALEALVQTIPSLELLSSERAQGVDGPGVSALIKQVQRITPKVQALQNRVKIEQINDACDQDQVIVKSLQVKADQEREKAEATSEQEKQNAGEEREETKQQEIETVPGRSQNTLRNFLRKAVQYLRMKTVKAKAEAKARAKTEKEQEERRSNEEVGRRDGKAEWQARLNAKLERSKETLKSGLNQALNDLRSSLSNAVAFDEGSLRKDIDQWSLQQLGGLHVRSYGVEQRLLVHSNGAWLEQSVTHSARGSAQHQLEGNDSQLSITLHPWNHAPLVLPLADFEALRARHASTLRSQHASIVDALSGQRLDIFDQCVPIKVVTTAKQALSKVNEVEGLALWLLKAHAKRRDAADTGPAACLLLTAPPAAGKTCLMSQLVMHVLDSKECDMVPILIKVQELQRHLLNKENRLVFEQSWNWVDAFLQCVHGAGSDQYRMLRQSLMARRALVLLDGIDEGGKARTAIERHVTEVLAPQGHVMLVTSRPAGLEEERFRNHFERVQLEPLSEVQQEEVIIKRLGKGEHSELLEYVRDSKRVPRDDETKQRVTGNPLMLSMVISIFQSKKGMEISMPTTITELYQTASKAMLERVDRKERGAAASAAAVPRLTSLLEATFFEAHAAEIRNFGDEQLNRAALALFATDKLQHPGGLNLDDSCAELPAEAKEALRAVRERVAQDRLPLLSLLEAEPLRMQSSHLSFQEYFTMRAICTGEHRLPRDSPPWKWSSFWANVAKLGSENGTKFGDGLLRAAGVEGDELNLSGELGGDLPTVLSVACAIMGSLKVLDLSDNSLGPEGGLAVAKKFKDNGSLTSLILGGNLIGPVGGKAVAEALLVNKSLKSLELALNGIKDEGSKLIGEALRVNNSLTSLDLTRNGIGKDGSLAIAGAINKVNSLLVSLNLKGNNLGPEGGVVIAEALRVNGSLRALDLSINKIGPKGGAAVAKALEANCSLISLNLGHNGIGKEGGAAIAEALTFNGSLTSLNIAGNDTGDIGAAAVVDALRVRGSLKYLILGVNGISPEGGVAIAKALCVKSSLVSLSLWDNKLGPEGGEAIAGALKSNRWLTELDLRNNQLGEAGSVAIANAMKINGSLTYLE